MKVTNEYKNLIKKAMKDYKNNFSVRHINNITTIEIYNSNDNLNGVIITSQSYDNNYNCFAWNCDFSFINLLRVNDRLIFEWHYNDSSDYINKANLIHGKLYANIYRNDNIIAKFLVKTSITADNTAKMIHEGFTNE